MNIDDPFAEDVAWLPLVHTKNGIGNRVLKIGKSEASFKLDEPSKLVLKIAGAGILVGLASPFIFFPNKFSFLGIFIYAFMVLSVILFSFRVFRDSTKPIKFCKSTQKFTKGKSEEITKLSDIHALQYIEKEVEVKKTEGGPKSITYYQLNLVLKNKDRVHVVDLRYQNLEDVQAIADFLDKPLWNRTENITEDN